MVAIQGSAFNNFEGVSYRALDAINQKEADKEMKRVNRLLKKMASRGQEVLKKTRFNDQNETLLSQTAKSNRTRERTEQEDKQSEDRWENNSRRANSRIM